MPVINFTGAEERGGFEAFRGRHHVAITDIEETATKTAGKLPEGTEGVTVEFTVLEGKYNNRKIWNNFWFAPSTLGFLKNMLVATGRYEMEDLEEEIDVDWDTLIGAELEVKTKIKPETEQYDAKTEIQSYKSYDPDKDYSGEGHGASSGSTLLP